MDQILWKRVEHVFHAALEAPPDQRADLIRQLSEGDDQVSGEVESLLCQYREEDTWLSPDAELQLRDAVDTAMRLLADQHLGSQATKRTVHNAVDSFSSSEVAKWLGAESDRFQDLRPLGRGGMGRVFYAMDRAMQRPVALKFLIHEGYDRKATSRILSESRALASLRSDHVVTVHEVMEREPHPYLVMEWVRGPSVRQLIDRRGRLPARFAAEIARQIAVGLADAHARQLLHGDIKPANVLLQRKSGTNLPWRAKIIDFGIAQSLAPGTTNSHHSNAWTGTPRYMSPERLFRQGQVDSRSDIYSLGILLFEMLVGDTPYRGTPAMLMRQLESDEPRSPRDTDPKLPSDLNSICLKAIAKNPSQRYESALSMALDLQRFLSGMPTLARPLSPMGRIERWARRNQWLALSLGSGAILAVLLMLTSLGTAWVFWSKNRQIAAERMRSDATLIEKIPTSHPAFIPDAVLQISKQVSAPKPILKELWDRARDEQSRYNVACALAMLGEPMHPYLVENVGNCLTDPAQCQTLLAALGTDIAASLQAIEASIDRKPSTQTHAKLLMLAHWLGENRFAEALLAPKSIELKTEWSQLFPRWHADLPTIVRNLRHGKPDAIMEANLLGLGLLDPAQLNQEIRQEISEILGRLQKEEQAPTIQAATEWLQRKLFPDPTLASKSYRMVLIPAGTFVMGNDDPSLQYAGRDAHEVELTRPFLIADKEVTVQAFQEFLEDIKGTSDDVESLADWNCDPVVSPTRQHPVQNVTWYEAVAYCNWLSRRSGLVPVYSRSGTWMLSMQDGSIQELPAWTLDPTANGFRLPTEAEHERVSRAGTSTHYFFGNDRKAMDHYIAWSNNTRVASVVPGTLMPNGYGLFDTLGNVWEWTGDWSRAFPKEKEVDPRSEAPNFRGFIFRGGGVCTFSGDPLSSSRGSALPDRRFLNVGFRVARNAP